MKLKIPYGISNYEEIISKDYYNVYKTRFIERLEEFQQNTNVHASKQIWKNTINWYIKINANKKKIEILSKV